MRAIALVIALVVAPLVALALDAREVARIALPSVLLVEFSDDNWKSGSQGSGFVVASGVVATSYHLVEDFTLSRVIGRARLSTGRSVPVRVVATDPINDVMLLAGDFGNTPPLKFGDPTKIEIGAPVFALGNPEGLVGTISPGIVSGRRAKDGVRLLQITAPISRGSSGGPIVDERAEVVGIATASLSEGQNLNFAVHSTYVVALMDNARQQTPVAAASNQSIQPLDLRLYSQADGVNVRSSPSTSATVLGQVSKGDSINVTGRSGDWYRVDYSPGRSGYILANLLAAARPAIAATQQPPAATQSPNTTPSARAQVAVGVVPRNPGDVFQECGECPEMAVIGPGRFTMGSPASERDLWEGPQRPVTIGRSFAVGKFEVTFAEWDACIAAAGCNGYRPPDQGWGRGRRPVINVSWNDAKAYVAWLSRRTGQTYRLLTEAEWEYVARAGTTTRYWWGNDIGRGNANCNGCGTQSDKTAPVGSFHASAFGVHDMLGNVWEWVEDCWHDDYKAAPVDGAAWVKNCSEASRVQRGGSWGYGPDTVRSGNRSGNKPVGRYSNSGFRVARAL